jgi:hypothetical protein
VRRSTVSAFTRVLTCFGAATQSRGLPFQLGSRFCEAAFARRIAPGTRARSASISDLPVKQQFHRHRERQRSDPVFKGKLDCFRLRARALRRTSARRSSRSERRRVVARAPRNDTAPHSRDTKRARAIAVETSSKQGGRRECRVRNTPIASHANEKAYELQSPQVRRFNRHSLRDGFTVSFVLAPETGLCCLRRQRDCRSILASLISASGYQAHTTSPSASVRLVGTHRHVHRIPRPTFRDDREAPLLNRA